MDFSGNSCILSRSNVGGDGQESSPQSHNAATLIRLAVDKKLHFGI